MPIPRGRSGGRKSTRGLYRPEYIPQRAWNAMLNQIEHAERRGIGFEMSPDEWWSWWQKDGRWERRGAGADRFCMARIGDVGPYAIGNIYCATNAQNIRDARVNGRLNDRPVGRRRKLSDQDVERAKCLLEASAITVANIAKSLNVSRDTLYSYLPGGRSGLRSH